MTDTVSTKVIGESPKRLVYYNPERLVEEDVIEIMNIDGMEQVHRQWPAQAVGANTVNAGDTPYTVTTFQDFARNNLGF